MRETREHVIFSTIHPLIFVLFYTFKIARTVSAKMFTHKKNTATKTNVSAHLLTYTQTRSLALTHTSLPIMDNWSLDE